MSSALFLALVLAVAAGRLVELRYSHANRRRLAEMGAKQIRDSSFPLMVALHAGYLIAAPLEVYALDRPFLPWLGFPALLLLLAANGFRYWVIWTLAVHWNTGVVASQDFGVVNSGPYRWIRHPNYAAVFVEVLALPLVHSAWLTAAAATLLNSAALLVRIRVEERILLGNPSYLREMGGKPRFVPRWRERRTT